VPFSVLADGRRRGPRPRERYLFRRERVVVVPDRLHSPLRVRNAVVVGEHRRLQVPEPGLVALRQRLGHLLERLGESLSTCVLLVELLMSFSECKTFS